MIPASGVANLLSVQPQLYSLREIISFKQTNVTDGIFYSLSW